MESLKIKVDVKRRTTENINLQQGYTYPIELTILDNGKEYDCTGAIPQIHFAKSNGTFNIKTKDITIEGNKVSFILDSEATNRSGTGKLQAVLTRNGFTFGSWAIFCNIFENVIQDGATEDKNVIDILTELKDEVTTAKPLADSLNANIPKAQPLVNSLNTQIPQATEIAREIESIIEEGGAVDKRDLGEYKKDFEGVEHDTLNSRLNRDFDNLNQRMNESSLLAYEGTSIKADNTYLGLTKDTVIKGRTLQNVFDYTKVVSTNALRQNNEIFSSNRVTWDYSFKVSDIILKPSTEYTVFIDYNKGTYTGSPEFRSNITTLLISPTFKMESSGVYRFKSMTQSEINLDSSLIYFKGGNPSNVEGNFSFQIMILEGDYTQTPLEELPFIEGIESTGDKSKNLFFGAFEEGQINSETGEEIAYNGRCRSVQYANIEPNKTYTVSMVQNVVSAPWTSIRLYKDNTFIKTVQDLHGKAKFTFESGEANRLRVTANISYNDVINCQIEEGTQATPYQEYYDGYKISGKSCGKNLCNGEVINNLALNLDGSEVYSLYSQTLRYVRVKPNTNYIFSNEPSYSDRQVIIEYDKNKNVLRNCFTDVNCRFTTGHDTNYISYYFYKGNLAIERSADINFQLEEGTTATSYEPYQESNYSYILNEPLRSLPNGVCDTIDLATGVLTRRVGKVVLDGSENWVYAEDYKYFRCPTFDYKGKTPLERTGENKHNFIQLCNLFKINTSWSGEQSFRDNIDIDGEFHTISNAGYKLCFRKLECTNVNSFKTWLQANPTTVIYELAEPTTEQLTPCQLKSFDTTTHIISDNKLMPIVSTKIPSDVNAVVQGLKAENVKLEKQLDSAIEELNNTDIDLFAIDWETDYRLCELEWTLLDTMKVETLAESKVVESRILSRYEQAKILIESGKYNKTTMEKQLTMYYNRNYLTKEEFNELMQLMNPIGEVETLEELDKVENI